MYICTNTQEQEIVKLLSKQQVKASLAFALIHKTDWKDHYYQAVSTSEIETHIGAMSTKIRPRLLVTCLVSLAEDLRMHLHITYVLNSLTQSK